MDAMSVEMASGIWAYLCRLERVMGYAASRCLFGVFEAFSDILHDEEATLEFTGGRGKMSLRESHLLNSGLVTTGDGLSDGKQ